MPNVAKINETTQSFGLDALKKRIISDNLCPELTKGATQLVMGEGSVDAEIVIIGEAPGKKEDELGRPFVGASGKFLDEMLASVVLAREDTYITNIVKYRPPNNRDPTKDEKKSFLPYLLQQILIVEPRLIITLGRHSMEYFLPEAKIGEAHGQAVHRLVELPDGTQANWLIMPLYHPAAALYNGSLREILFADIVKVKSLLDTQ